MQRRGISRFSRTRVKTRCLHGYGNSKDQGQSAKLYTVYTLNVRTLNLLTILILKFLLNCPFTFYVSDVYFFLQKQSLCSGKNTLMWLEPSGWVHKNSIHSLKLHYQHVCDKKVCSWVFCYWHLSICPSLLKQAISALHFKMMSNSEWH